MASLTGGVGVGDICCHCGGGDCAVEGFATVGSTEMTDLMGNTRSGVSLR